MNEYTANLRVYVLPVSAVLAGLGVTLALFSETVADPQARLRVEAFSYLLLAVSAGAWLLHRWKPLVGRWFTITTLVVIVHLGNDWLGVPGFLNLLVIPTVLAAALISLTAAGITAVGETALLLLLPKLSLANASPAVVFVALTAIWAMFGIMYATYHPIHQVIQWSQSCLRRAHDLMKVAAERQVELKQALEDLAHTNLQLTRLNIVAQGLRQKAEEAQRAKEQFVAAVSHELRTPLNMIIGFTEMIVQAPEVYGGNLPPSLLADLDVVLRNSRHLSELIDDVLDLSQIEAGQMALTKERVALEQVIEMATMAVRPLFESKGLYLNFEIHEELPKIFCDRTRIRQVVLNLLSNAGRFTHKGGVHICARQEDGYVSVSVADTGSGIAPEAMDKLFQPFQQADGSIRRRYGGTGLGLAISKQFIELHEGKIWVESEEGTGTTFFFRLPIDPPAPLDSNTSRWFSPYLRYEDRTRRSRVPASVIRPRFVVLERGNTLERLVTRYLDGAEIVCVADPQEAVRELTRVPSQALLVNDTAMDETLRSFDVPVALPQGTPMITCHIPGIGDSTRTLGIVDYLIKPVSRDTLLAILERLRPNGKTLLLVDDEPEALRLFRRMLASSGRDYRILKATDGQEGMQILREERPDAILLDLIMPNMDGFRFLAEKNCDQALRDIPVVVISARDPIGQPIVSDALTVTQRAGLSASQLLACIEAIAKILSTVKPDGDSALTKALAG